MLSNWLLIVIILITAIPAIIMGVISDRVARRRGFGRVGRIASTIAGILLGLVVTLVAMDFLLELIGSENIILS